MDAIIPAVQSGVSESASDPSRHTASQAPNGMNNNQRAAVLLAMDEITVISAAPEESRTPKHMQYDLAATLLKDAKSNRFLPFKTDPRSLKLYTLYYHPAFIWIQHVVVSVILALAMFEKPAIWELDFWACHIIELTCLGYLLMRVTHLALFQHKTDFWKDKKNAVALILILVSIVDVIVYTIWMLYAPNSNPVKITRPLRPLFIVNFPHARQIRAAFRNIRRTLVEIIFVLILFFFSILIFALLALKLFKGNKLKDRFGEPYFSGYINSFWNLYVLVTTANNPDVMMPAYDYNGLYAIFFIVFIIINLYIFMNVLLAVIFNSYKKHLKNEVKMSVYSKRRKLAEAFDLIKERKQDQSGSCLTAETWKELMGVLSPKKSVEQINMLFQVMDNDGDGEISKAEFLIAADLLNVPLTEVKDRLIIWDRLFGRFYNHSASRAIKIVIRSRWFRYFFDFAIVVNAVFIAIEKDEAEFFFLALFTLEILLKLYAYGPKRFVSQFWNNFDVIVIGGAMIATIVEATTNRNKLEGDTLDFILIIRVLRLIKIVNGIERFRIVITTLINIGPSMLIYGQVLFTFLYFFAIIGMEAFQNRIRFFGDRTYNDSVSLPNETFCGNVALNGSDFFEARYCKNNFNNIGKALVVLIELTVVNQWHVITSGFEKVTHPTAKIYFISFHLVVVVLIMNIFIAFILEAFILEYSLSKSKFESRLEAKIIQLGYGLGQKKLNKSDKKEKAGDKLSIVDRMQTVDDEEDIDMDPYKDEGIRFHMKSGRRKVETLLERMFEDELDPEDMGSNESLQTEQRPRVLTMEYFVQ